MTATNMCSIFGGKWDSSLYLFVLLFLVLLLLVAGGVHQVQL